MGDRITREQFESKYAAGSGVTLEFLREHGREAMPCDCGEPDCEGWQMGRPLEAVSLSLPDDMADAFESMKLAIMRNRADGWREVSSDMTIQALWELQKLAMKEAV